MRSRTRPTRSGFCAKSGACWPAAAACWRWCRTGAGCGRAWTRRRSAMAAPIRARSSRICCARPGSRRWPGAKRFTCRRSDAAGSCAPPSPGSAPGPPSRRRLPACISSRRPSRSIAQSRPGASGAGWCRYCRRCWRRRRARPPGDSRIVAAAKKPAHCGHGSAVTAAASAPVNSARLSKRWRSSAPTSADLMSATRPRPRNTSAE